MLMCVAREKSPIGSEEAMTSVWYFPGESAMKALLLPVRCSFSLRQVSPGGQPRQAGRQHRKEEPG